MFAAQPQLDMTPGALRIGIDPGLNGALAVLDDTRVYECFGFPKTPGIRGKQILNFMSTVNTLRRIVETYGMLPVFIENPNPVSGNQLNSVLAFGRSNGIIEAAIAQMRMPAFLVGVSSWKSKAGLTKTKKNPHVSKDDARDVAARLLPSAYPFVRTSTDKAEAILVGYFGPQIGTPDAHYAQRSRS